MNTMLLIRINDNEWVELGFIEGDSEGAWTLTSHIERSDVLPRYNAAIDAVEALLLAIANNGVNLANPALLKAFCDTIRTLAAQYKV